MRLSVVLPLVHAVTPNNALIVPLIVCIYRLMLLWLIVGSLLVRCMVGKWLDKGDCCPWFVGSDGWRLGFGFVGFCFAVSLDAVGLGFRPLYI